MVKIPKILTQIVLLGRKSPEDLSPATLLKVPASEIAAFLKEAGLDPDQGLSPRVKQCIDDNRRRAEQYDDMNLPVVIRTPWYYSSRTIFWCLTLLIVLMCALMLWTTARPLNWFLCASMLALWASYALLEQRSYASAVVSKVIIATLLLFNVLGGYMLSTYLGKPDYGAVAEKAANVLVNTTVLLASPPGKGSKVVSPVNVNFPRPRIFGVRTCQFHRAGFNPIIKRAGTDGFIELARIQVPPTSLQEVFARIKSENPEAMTGFKWYATFEKSSWRLTNSSQWASFGPEPQKCWPRCAPFYGDSFLLGATDPVQPVCVRTSSSSTESTSTVRLHQPVSRFWFPPNQAKPDQNTDAVGIPPANTPGVIE